MSKTPRHADRDLFFQVLGTIAMCVLAFVEMAFGQFPVFYGSAPLIMVIGVVILVHYLPVALPLAAVVLAGLVFDLLQGVPPGFTPSLLLLAMIISLSRAPVLAHADAGTVWYEFAFVLAGLQLYSFGLNIFWSGAVPAIRPYVFQYAVTVLIFPILFWGLAPLKVLTLPERSG